MEIKKNAATKVNRTMLQAINSRHAETLKIIQGNETKIKK